MHDFHTTDRQRANARYWADRKADYPFRAQSPQLAPSPFDVARAGFYPFIAVAMPDGLTYWGFEEEADRDRFLDVYPEALPLAVEAVFGSPA